MTILDTYLEQFRASAQDIFAKQPQLRSLLLATAQYWADEADDAVHDCIVGSERDLPLWPHLCNGGWDDEENPVEEVAGEVCTRCAELLGRPGYLTWWHDNGDAIRAFEAFCHESGSQDQSDSYNSLPAAIARKRGDSIEIELLGPVVRPHSILHGSDGGGSEDPMWADARALELYAQVCASPADDGPRRVLADYLLEREVPRTHSRAAPAMPSCSRSIARPGCTHSPASCRSRPHGSTAVLSPPRSCSRSIARSAAIPR